jgi:hypothetical protein
MPDHRKFSAIAGYPRSVRARRRSTAAMAVMAFPNPSLQPARTHIEPTHDEDDVITASEFPFDELIPDWANFNAMMKNPAIGSTFSNSHHGPNGARKRADFINFDLACCLEWIDVMHGDVSRRARCMNVFTVEINQCTTHRKVLYKDGRNKIYEMLRRGDDASWGDIKDTR